MRLNPLFAAFAVVTAVYGIVGLVLPAFLMPLLWVNPPGENAYLLLQGWGVALFAFGIIAWGARTFTSPRARRVVALAFFADTLITAAIWLLDTISRGWTVFSAVSFAILVLFALGFGYFGLLAAQPASPPVQS